MGNEGSIEKLVPQKRKQYETELKELEKGVSKRDPDYDGEDDYDDYDHY